MAKSVDELSKLLSASGLLSNEKLQECLAQLPSELRPQDGEALARELVKQKILIKFQAEQIYVSGRF